MSEQRFEWPDVPRTRQLCEGCEDNPADIGDFLCPECREAEQAEAEWWHARQKRLREWADEDHDPEPVDAWVGPDDE